MSETTEITLTDLDIVDLHDAAHDIWCDLHPTPDDAEFYDCKLCGATMYPCNDYTHDPDCPYAAIGRAIDAFGDAVRVVRASEAASGPQGEA